MVSKLVLFISSGILENATFMSNSGDQNGRQPPVPNQTAPPADPRTKNVSDQQNKICRDFAWGICTKGSQCKFRHELDPEAMKSIIKFCHDFQNRTGCTRADCTYLHSSREEENLFLSAGQLPRALAERHSAMSLAPPGSVAPESAPQIMYLPEPYMSHPPPRPPLPVIMHSVSAPPPPPPPPLPAAALQPPPPPPPPPTAGTSSVQMTTPMFSGPPPLNPPVVFSVNQPPPPLPPMFDASRPPPPLPVQPTNNKKDVKRPMAVEPFEAGPSKVRKTECAKVVDGPCENCIQREIRIEIYRQKMQKMHCEEEYQSLIYKKKLEEYETGRALLKAAIGPELFRILDEDIEGTSQPSQVPDILAQYNQAPTFKQATPTVPNQLVFQLMECLLNKRNVIDSTPAAPALDVDEAALVQSLLALRRRQSPVPIRSSSEVLSTILEAMRNSAASDSSQERVATPAERAGPSAGPSAGPPASPSTRSPAGPSAGPSGSPSAGPSAGPSAAYPRFVNGQKMSVAPPPAAAAVRYPPVPQCAGAPPRTYVAPQPAPAYPPFQPAVPPPSRPYYPHHYHNNTTAAAPVPSVYPSRVAAPPAASVPAPAPAPAPAPVPHNTQYTYPPAPWRHSAQSRYYPPAQ